jgi:hypothetical protein
MPFNRTSLRELRGQTIGFSCGETFRTLFIRVVAIVTVQIFHLKTG